MDSKADLMGGKEDKSRKETRIRGLGRGEKALERRAGGGGTLKLVFDGRGQETDRGDSNREKKRGGVERARLEWRARGG